MYYQVSDPVIRAMAAFAIIFILFYFIVSKFGFKKQLDKFLLKCLKGFFKWLFAPLWTSLVWIKNYLKKCIGYALKLICGNNKPPQNPDPGL